MTRPATYCRAGRPAGESGASAMTRLAATLRGPGRERGERCERDDMPGYLPPGKSLSSASATERVLRPAAAV